MSDTRESNYELLRIISALAVIAIHVSGSYTVAITSAPWFGTTYTDNMFINCLYNAISRFAVPCFIMISGAFTLDNEKNCEFKYYYGKMLKSLGVTVIIISGLYFLYSSLQAIVAVVVRGREVTRLFVPLQDVIIGEPYYHLWYLYMMVGIFILTPVIIRLKKEVGDFIFTKIAIIFFPLAILSLWTSTHKLNWDLGYSFCYLGYYMLGYVLRKKFQPYKNNLWACSVVMVGFLILTGMAYLRYRQGIAAIPDSKLTYQLVVDYCPLPALASVMIFSGFSMLHIDTCVWGGVNKLASISFEIYLFHAGIWDIVRWTIKGDMDSRIVIPTAIVLVFALSAILSVLYKKLWRIIDRKVNITYKLTKYFRLN